MALRATRGGAARRWLRRGDRMRCRAIACGDVMACGDASHAMSLRSHVAMRSHAMRWDRMRRCDACDARWDRTRRCDGMRCGGIARSDAMACDAVRSHAAM